MTIAPSSVSGGPGSLRVGPADQRVLTPIQYPKIGPSRPPGADHHGTW